ncbi:membrane protein insertion efficiency factor YidD [Nitrincola sp. MINF-07-Sa-05]|uniref:membrane protein insertion efficiency factor YidD n=1 Tax=Nitrincola salilacus TaxID=3400273 RepID=UPI003917DF86
MRWIRGIISRFFILLVKFYQYFISPLIPPSCRFYPSCSSYMIEAIQVHGPFKGLWLGLRRVSRCHPWNDGGIDPVPPRCCQHEDKND